MDNDGGYKSRKMIMAYVAMAAVVVGFLATGKWESLQVSFGEFCMAVLGATSIYVGGNTAVKWMSARAAKASPKDPQEDPPAEKDPAEKDPAEK